MAGLVRRGLPAVAVLGALTGLVACGGPGTTPTPTTPSAPASSASTTGAVTPGTATATASGRPPAAAEPTTTNTLPPPPRPTAAARSTAGELTAKALPVPAGWRTVALDGGDEEGFRGNGTWVHERDPRYAAQDVIGIGCAPVTRDDYADPVAALEGNYRGRGGRPGVGLALQFADPDAAERYFALYSEQVRACRTPGGPVRTTLIPGVDGLADHRRYDDGDWTEVARRTGPRVVLVILSDPGHTVDRTQANAILAQVG